MEHLHKLKIGKIGIVDRKVSVISFAIGYVDGLFDFIKDLS